MRILIIGLDAFDPFLFERLYEKGKLPNLGGILDKKGYSRFAVANPPQSEVSWTSIATGMNPGEHGMFDFVHRDPDGYNLQVSLLPTSRGFGGTRFIRPYNAKTIFDIASDRGFPSTSLWWPATFPARPDSPVRTIPGLGTPDIQGRLGVGSFYSTNLDVSGRIGKTPVFPLQSLGDNKYKGELEGPQISRKSGQQNAILPFDLHKINRTSAEIRFNQQIIKVETGKWSPIIELKFKASMFASVFAITRLVVTSLEPTVQVYFLPLQIHPLHPIWHYGTPMSFVKDSWQSCGPFLTLGWPQDTTGLEDGCINDEQFLSLCDSIFEARSKLLFHQLSEFREGILASVFDSLDRIQHMFLRRRPDVIEAWYVRYDRMIGEVLKSSASNSAKPMRIIIVSDHGFYNLDNKVHLNRWLMDQGYLAQKPGSEIPDWKSIDWSKTKAYAIGLNSLYLNRAGRESQGLISAEESPRVLADIQRNLLEWKFEGSQPVIKNAFLNDQVFKGSLSSLGPDMLVGYSPGFRASAETGIGGWDQAPLVRNQDHWEADHCFDASSVPGVIFSSYGLGNYPNPSYSDFPALAIDAVPDSKGSTPPPKLNKEDQDKVEERLKSLGYL